MSAVKENRAEKRDKENKSRYGVAILNINDQYKNYRGDSRPKEMRGCKYQGE